MDDQSNAARFRALALSDKQLLEELFSMLSKSMTSDPHGEDGAYAAALRELPVGLRAMAATHHLDISLTLDDIGWHFLNFGELGLVAETEAGLRVLGLADLADWFAEARDIMGPLRSEINAPEDYDECLTRHGRRGRINELTNKAQDLGIGCNEDVSCSPIFNAWIKYTRQHPEQVFPG
jgi:hypothetical protein